SYANEIEKNEENAFKCYLLSSQLGLPEALFFVEKCYYMGQDVKKNNKKALEYFTKAYNNNYFAAKFFMNGCKQDVFKDEENFKF
ncbi:32590_t:CDS:1, partial [Racocetra persica]